MLGGTIGAFYPLKIKLSLEQSSSLLKRGMPRNLFRVWYGLENREKKSKMEM
jgi:hypothetical protein